MLQNLSSAAVLIGALRVKDLFLTKACYSIMCKNVNLKLPCTFAFNNTESNIEIDYKLITESFSEAMGSSRN